MTTSQIYKGLPVPFVGQVDFISGEQFKGVVVPKCAEVIFLSGEVFKGMRVPFVRDVEFIHQNVPVGVLPDLVSAALYALFMPEVKSVSRAAATSQKLLDAYRLRGVRFDDQRAVEAKNIAITVRLLDSEKDYHITLSNMDSVLTLKQKLLADESIPIELQRISYEQLDLEDHCVLEAYLIREGSTLNLVRAVDAQAQQICLADFGKLAPQYDRVYTEKDRAKTYSRGGQVYLKPVGWQRIGLKVIGKFENDIWLGNSDGVGVWPVSYHGTSRDSMNSIAGEGYMLSKSFNFAYGRGIYSSPDIAVAEGYTKTFTNGGQTFRVALQNRVNPASLKIATNKIYVSEKQEDIRPYGILIKRS
jgi:hypothetical protein